MLNINIRKCQIFIVIIKKKMKFSADNLKIMIAEELTKPEINSLIKSKIDDNMNSQDFKRKVKVIVSDVINELFKILWQRNTMWKSSVAS